jgi:hypothetical protein
MNLRSNGYFVIGVALMASHYKTDTISGVDHSKLDTVVPLVLCTIEYNIQGTDVVLQVHRDNANLVKK